MNLRLEPPRRPLPSLDHRSFQPKADLRVSIISDAIVGRNGVGTYYLDLIEHLRDLVDSVELIGPACERDPSLERFSIPMPGDPTQRLGWPNRISLRRRLNRQQPNLIVLPSLGAYSYFGWRYAKEHHIPLLVVNHTNFDRLLALYWPPAVSRPLGWCLQKLNRWLIRQASMVAALNSDSYQAAKQLGADSVRIMGTPVAKDFLTQPKTSSSPIVRRVLFVGRLAKEKGIDQILQAAESMPGLTFSIVGDGPGRQSVEAAAVKRTNVDYLGWLARDEVLRQMDDTDVLLLPSAIEAFGTVALEALARRRYVLVRKSCGIAKWPAFANGLFYIDEDQSVADGIDRFCGLTVKEREATGEIGWHAVDDFNRHTIRVWLRFLSDAASNQRCEATFEDVV
ncbi:glycosyltransferase [Roseiconus lacunae]|uniref:Glycosyltransferase n=2 Tax=Roseiconus lacunae TaxID=2605694 RepID=A0ABT7PJK9_9BACT|nr:glycosyltransferase [Roseiconus lacunae]MDM4016523.1 glycosyltransferase [Roseiconus lacunae]